MPSCDVSTLMENGRCFAAMNPHGLNAVIAQLWCNVAEGLANAGNDNPALQSSGDSEWYRINGMEISPGNALPTVSQVATTPGPDPHLVIENLTDGLFYEVRLVGVPPLVELEIDPIATGDPEIPAVITVSGTDYNLKIVNDPFPTLTLVPV